MKTEHVKTPTRRESTSKLVFDRQWDEMQPSLPNLQHCLLAHYGVETVTARLEQGGKVRIVVRYKSAAKSDEHARHRAHAVDGFIGGWLAASHPSFGLQAAA